VGVPELERAIAGGGLIGAAATIYWRVNGRVAGVSGIVSAALSSKSERATAVSFLAGLAVAGLAGAALTTSVAPATDRAPLLALAGLLVGVGTRLGGGCTSGHGVCGLSRLSRRSLAATLTFILTGALTVLVVSRWLPASRGS
jgi:uncharacterized membrane protein YedE/YeeE